MYTNNMRSYLRCRKQKHAIGFSHGRRGIYNPGQIWGEFQAAYDRGHKQGRRVTVKTKK